jgi:raffinose/stachyose/melibiose transport system permease protein
MTFTVAIALLFALLLNQRFKGRAIFRGIFYFPYVLSAVIVGTIWTWIYHPQLGLITNLLDIFGLQVKPFLADPKTAFLAIYAAGLWQAYGAPMVLFLAGLQTIPYELYEAARIDGANVFQTFFKVTIPMLKETFVIVFATQIITSVKIFDIVMAMTLGEPSPANKTHTMATWMIKQSFVFTHAGRGAAIACIMVLVLMAVIIPFVLYMAKD